MRGPVQKLPAAVNGLAVVAGPELAGNRARQLPPARWDSVVVEIELHDQTDGILLWDV